MSELGALLHPRRFTEMSPRMTAIVAYVLGEHLERCGHVEGYHERR